MARKYASKRKRSTALVNTARKRQRSRDESAYQKQRKAGRKRAFKWIAKNRVKRHSGAAKKTYNRLPAELKKIIRQFARSR